MSAPSYRLCAATPDDLEVTYAITRDAMRDYVEQTWGRWDEGEQRRRHRENYTAETHRLVKVDAVVAGLMATENLPGHLWLMKLYPFSAFRGNGIGSALLAHVFREADELGKPVRLQVLRVNVRAQALYATHGFAVVEQTPERISMERPRSVADAIF